MELSKALKKVNTIDELNKMPISALGINDTRCMNCLKNFGAKTVGDVASTTDKELLEIPHFGKRSLAILRKAVNDLRSHNGFFDGHSCSQYQIVSDRSKLAIWKTVDNLANIYKATDDESIKYMAGVSLMMMLSFYGMNESQTRQTFVRITS